MREILFKAKRKNWWELPKEERWIEGYYMPRPNSPGKPRYYIILLSQAKWHEIDPDTLCQYTGLADKKGRKIWQNDIISISAYSYDEPEDDYFGIVAYSEKDVCWCLKNSESSEEIICICECFGSYTTEIINHGNIFDNPELLETSYEKSSLN